MVGVYGRARVVNDVWNGSNMWVVRFSRACFETSTFNTQTNRQTKSMWSLFPVGLVAIRLSRSGCFSFLSFRYCFIRSFDLDSLEVYGIGVYIYMYISTSRTISICWPIILPRTISINTMKLPRVFCKMCGKRRKMFM